MSRTSTMKFRKTTLLIILVLQTCLTCAPPKNDCDPLLMGYTVPVPSIQVFSPRGLKVSIPHVPGIQLFAFHGNINKHLESLRAGQLSRDVLKQEGGEWVFKDAHIKLDIGDEIYYWLYVIKDQLGYRYDDGTFQVKEITPGSLNGDHSVPHHPHQTVISHAIHGNNEGTTTESPRTQQIPNNPKPVTCEEVLGNLTASVYSLQLQIESLRDTNNILRDMVQKIPGAAVRTLTLDGTIPPSSEPLLAVHNVITQKLGLSIRPITAVRKPNGRITFEVGNIDEKIEIIKATKEKLRNSRIAIIY